MRTRRLLPHQIAIVAGLMLTLAMDLPARAQTPDASKLSNTPPKKSADDRWSDDKPPPLGLDGKPRFEIDARPTGSPWRDYAFTFNKSLQAALEANDELRTALASDYVVYEVWVEPTGHVARANLVKAFGKTKLDAAFRDGVLLKLRLPRRQRICRCPSRGRSVKAQTNLLQAPVVSPPPLDPRFLTPAFSSPPAASARGLREGCVRGWRSWRGNLRPWRGPGSAWRRRLTRLLEPREPLRRGVRPRHLLETN